MKPFNSWSIRAHLTFVVVLALLPAMGIVVYSGIQHGARARRQAEQECRVMAQNLGAHQQLMAATTRELLVTLTTLPEIKALQVPSCNAILKDIQQQYAQYAVLLLANPGGEVVAAGVTLTNPISIADRQYFQETLRTRDFSVGEYVVSRSTQKQVLHFAYPAMTPQQQVVAVAVAALDLASLERVLALAELPQNASLVLLDRQGVVLHASGRREPVVGQPESLELFQKLAGKETTGSFITTTRDGVSRYFSFQQLRLRPDATPYLYLYLDFPEDQTTAEARRSLARDLILLGLSAILALGIAWLVGNATIIGQVNRLTAAARRLGQGDLNTRTGISCRNNELGQLGNVFDEMASRLATRESERQQSQEALRQERDFSTTILNTIGALVVGLDGQGKIVSFNRACEVCTGYTETEVKGKPLWDFLLVPEEIEPVKNVFRALEKNKVPSHFENYWIHKSGERRLIAWSNSVLKNAAGTVEYVLGTGIDITERRRAEEDLRTTNQELQAINNIVLACTTQLDLQPLLERMLDESLAIAGVEGGALCLVQSDQTLKVTVHRDASAAILQDLSQKVIHLRNGLGNNSDKEAKPVVLRDWQADQEIAADQAIRQDAIHFHAAFPLMAQGQCLGMLGVFSRTRKIPSERRLKLLETITSEVAMAIRNAQLYQETVHHAEHLEKKVRERTAQLEAANEELEAFSYSVSHDLKTPLRHVTGFVDLLRDHLGSPLDAENRRLLDIIRQAAAKMSQLVEDLLLFSRMGRTAMRPLDIELDSLVGEIIRETKRDHPHRQVDWHVAPLPVVRADLNLLRQVWVNLLDNAVKYTRLQAQARIEIGWEQGANEENIFWIRDNGVGFDMQFADRLFGVFQRLHPEDQFEGTGIGLANVRRIIHRHGGRTWAEASVGQGATIFFSLPKTAPPPPPLPESRPAKN